MRPCVHSYDEQTAQYRVHAQKQSFFPGVQAIFYLQWEHNKQPISGGVLKNILCLPWVEGARGLYIIINNGNLTRLNFVGRGPLMVVHVPLLKNFDFQEECKLILRTCCSCLIHQSRYSIGFSVQGTTLFLLESYVRKYIPKPISIHFMFFLNISYRYIVCLNVKSECFRSDPLLRPLHRTSL